MIFFFAVSTPSYLSLSFPEDPYRPSATRPYIVDENSTFIGQAWKGNETSFLYSVPVANRSWVDLNYGRLLWPKLEGYRLLDTPASEKKGSSRTSSAIKAVIQEQNPHASRTEEVEPIEPAAPDVSSSVATAKATPQPRRRWFDWSKATFLEGGSSGLEEKSAYPASVVHVADPEPPAAPEPTTNYHADYSDDYVEAPSEVYGDEQVAHPRLPWYAYMMNPSQIPSRYDLRVRGVGFVLDLGMRRKEQAVKQEVREWKAWEATKKRKMTLKIAEAQRDQRLKAVGTREEL